MPPRFVTDSLATGRTFTTVSPQAFFVFMAHSLSANKLNYTCIEYQKLLRLPEKINPGTRELANSLRFLPSGVAVSDAQFINNILGYFAQDFIYTWQPPVLTAPSQMDQFLFESRQGFCEHYASALAVIARMQGIPARIVNGYLGGTLRGTGLLLVGVSQPRAVRRLGQISRSSIQIN